MELLVIPLVWAVILILTYVDSKKYDNMNLAEPEIEIEDYELEQHPYINQEAYNRYEHREY